MSDISRISRRKTEHLDICRKQPVEFQTTSPWFEHVALIHQAVPSCSMSEIDISTEFLSKRLAAPFIIGAMTGGTPEAGEINRQLARIAAEKGVGLALGSQRPMLEDPTVTETYRVREYAPDAVILGNIGLSQALELPVKRVVELVKEIRADGICLHLNSAMEMFQSGGDEPRGKAFVAIGRLANALGDRLIIKETGCGIARETAAKLKRVGVKTLDVAGAGGTSWVRVETFRHPRPNIDEFTEWGIPTAASLMEMSGLGLDVISSGGIRSGLDIAKSIALGARLASAALPILRALDKGGPEAVAQWVDSTCAGLRAAMLLTGCRTLKELRGAPLVITGPLAEWAEQRRIGRKSVERTA